MSLKKYRALLEAVDSGSLTRAAENLHYTQPGISHMILSLEEEFGFSLLSRGKSGVTPTAEAEKLLVWMRQIVNGEDKLRETVQQDDTRPCPPMATLSFTPPSPVIVR